MHLFCCYGGEEFAAVIPAAGSVIDNHDVKTTHGNSGENPFNIKEGQMH
jgi:hypothetical protein